MPDTKDPEVKKPKIDPKNKLIEERRQKQEQINKRVIPNKTPLPSARFVTVKGTVHTGTTHEDRDLTLPELHANEVHSILCLLDQTYDLTGLNAKSLDLANIPTGSIIDSIGYMVVDPITPAEAKLSVTLVNPDVNPTLLIPAILTSDKVITLTSDVNLTGGCINLKVCYRCPRC